MAERWTLSRAGIVNVYQYGDETLHFHGGRLLLRGVNGSGKSTAMNMLLPFLLDTDTRRIDAAGEQSGVLRSWMLAGRDEQQPVGYLWIEFRCGEEYLTLGCGIRANRSTDRVTTWWFVTPRRPGIDLALVEDRTPLTSDALRAVLGAPAVFPENQRAAYRAAVREALFGGADLDQHIRLLHILRNPRVGDRIDLDLADYLTDALPQLSEAALDDAAQPLEDLEEHRRNVETLTRTTTALDALEAVYRNYAQAELHRRARQVGDLVDEHGRRRREERNAVENHRAATVARDEAAGAVAALEGKEQQLGAEIEGLKASDAYKRGVELNDLRAHVATLAGQVTTGTERAETAQHRLGEERASVAGTERQARDDWQRVRDGLSDLGRFVTDVGLPHPPPTPPALETTPSPVDGVDVPRAPLAVEPVEAGLAGTRTDLVARQHDVREVLAALATVDRAELAVRAAEKAEREAQDAEAAAQEEFAGKRTVLDQVVQRWRDDLRAWGGQLDAHRGEEDLPAIDPELLVPADLVAARDRVADAMRDVVQATVAHHQGIAATLDARRAMERSAVDDLEERRRELEAMTLPDPPSAPWQRPGRGPCLAELVDFGSSVDAGAQAGIEAALEAAGLLGAELQPGAGLVLADGQLVALAGERAAHPLSELLVVVLPDDAGDVTPEAVAGVLDAISTDPADLAGSAVAVVTVDGRFRTGALAGRHAKPEAEHVGVSARRTALDRRRAATAADLADARAVLARTDEERAHRAGRLDEVATLRRDLPSPRPVGEAQAAAELAERALASARTTVGNRRQDRLDEESSHAAAVDAAERLAAEHGLPAERRGLDRVGTAITDAQRLCEAITGSLGPLARTVTQWIKQGDACDRAAQDLAGARTALAAAEASHRREASRLAALEDAVGVDYEEVRAAVVTCERELETTRATLETARAGYTDAYGQVQAWAERVEGAVERREVAESTCVASLPHLQRALQVPGLVMSALLPDDAGEADTPGFPAVPETPEGARQLAGHVLASIPAPSDLTTTGDSVRLSLRQRRDALGAGWDAEDRQPDESLPLSVEVTGPLGRMPLYESARRAAAQLRSMAGLLSAKQDQALRNLLEGLIAREIAVKLQAARELVGLMNDRLESVKTSHGIGVSLHWRRRDDLDAELVDAIALLAKPPDLRTQDDDNRLASVVAGRLADARAERPEAGYRELIALVLDYRQWHRMVVTVHRPGRGDERLGRRTALSEGEKKMVSYLPLFAAVAASCDALAESNPAAPRFVLLDDAFAKVSEDNHAKLFGLLVEMDLDFVATSERLWGTHESVPELAITEVLRDATLGVIVLEHSRWDGRERMPVA